MKSRFLFCEFMHNQLKSYCNTQHYDYKCREVAQQMKMMECHDYGFQVESHKEDMTWLILHFFLL